MRRPALVAAACLAAAAGPLHAEFLGSGGPTSFSLCESSTDATGRPRPECQGGDLRFQYDGAAPADSEFGFAVAAGHLNGDDRVDLVVGDPKRNRVYVFFGRASASIAYALDPNDLADRMASADAQADVILTREPPFPGQVRSFGFSLAVSAERLTAAGCAPGGKAAALLIGAPGKPGTTGNDPGTAFYVPPGRLCVAFTDPPTPMVADPTGVGGVAFRSPGAAPDDEFGYSVALGRLLTNTGSDPDAVVGARGAGGGAGGVTVFPVTGGSVVLALSSLVRIEGTAGEGLGESMAVGDFDGDFDPNTVPNGKLDDLAVGAVGHPNGKVIVLQGPAAPTDGRDGDGILREGIDSQIRSIVGEMPGDFFGFSVAVSAQGDLAAGAVLADNNVPNDQQPGGGDPLTNVDSGDRFNAGKVYVWEADVVDAIGTDTEASTADVVYVARRSGDQLGFALAYGDLDGSGRDDLAMAARREDGSGLKVNEIEQGTVYVVYDGSSLSSPVDLNLCAVSSDCTGTAGVDVMIFGGDRAGNAGEEIGFSIAAGNFNGGDASADLFVASLNDRRVYAVTLEDTDADRLTKGRNLRDDDDDNDGAADPNDCDPVSTTIKPGAAEITCNRIDEDCDGLADDAPDADADGFDVCNDNTPGDRDDKAADCADADPNSHPGSLEVCDGNDNDCSGSVPAVEQDADADLYVGCTGWADTQGDNPTILGGGDCDRTDPFTFPGSAPKEANPAACMRDRDRDDFGDAAPPVGVTAGTDCDDGSTNAAATFPGAAPNEANPAACMKDLDGDDFGDVAAPPGVARGNDCNDADAGSRPGAAEVCDGNDNDCSGAPLAEEVDADGDRWVGCTPFADPQGDNPLILGGGDCAPADPFSFPGASPNETAPAACTRDADGDDWGDLTPPAGVTAGTDCDDDPPNGAAAFPGAAQIEAPLNCMKDGDDDGWGDAAAALPVVPGADCDDALATAFPGAPEVLNDGIDQDCSGADTITCFEDVDGDGFGSSVAVPASDGSCTDPGESATSDDCNDASTSIFPGAAETADDGIDQDCNGADARTCILDADRDGFGTALGTPVVAGDGQCDAAQQEASSGGDCDDADPATRPGGAEVCDGNDNDCSAGVPAGETDPDGDGYAACGPWSDTQGDDPAILGGGDCDPADADTFPGASPNEVFPAACTRDEDGDDFGDLSPPPGVTRGTDCDDDTPAGPFTFPGAAQIEAPLNCMKDADDDGYGDAAAALPVVRGTDCDDAQAGTHPGASESCDGDDNDCSSGIPAGEADADGDGFVQCTPWLDVQGNDPGILGGGDCDPADPFTSPGAAPNEPFAGACMQDKDGDDFGDLTPPPGVTAGTDCDDDTAAGPATFPGAAEIEAPLNCMKDSDADGWGDAAALLPVVAGTDCDDADPAAFPGAPEIPGDGIDQDCNGTDPAACRADLDGDGFGGTLLPEGSAQCAGSAEAASMLDCNDADAAVHPNAAEACGDGVDSDCDGIDPVCAPAPSTCRPSALPWWASSGPALCTSDPGDRAASGKATKPGRTKGAGSRKRPRGHER